MIDMLIKKEEEGWGKIEMVVVYPVIPPKSYQPSEILPKPTSTTWHPHDINTIFTTGSPEYVFRTLSLFNKKRGGSNLEFADDRIACHYFIQEGAEVETTMVQIGKNLYKLSFSCTKGDRLAFAHFYQEAWTLWLHYFNDHKR